MAERETSLFGLNGHFAMELVDVIDHHTAI
jgi:hypothetical protein